MATHDKHDHESASATSAGDANLQQTVDRLQSQLANEVSEIRNFAGVAVLVFAAAMLFMLAWDTTAVPLEHHMLPARDYELDGARRLQRKREELHRNLLKAEARAEGLAFGQLQAVIAEHNFGASLSAADGGVSVGALRADSPAKALNLAPGDVVLAVNGAATGSLAAAHLALSDLVEGQSIQVKVKSAGAESVKDAVFAEQQMLSHVKHDFEVFAAAAAKLTAAYWATVKKLDGAKRQTVYELERSRDAAEEREQSDKVERLNGHIAKLEEAFKAAKEAAAKVRDKAVSDKSADAKAHLSGCDGAVALLYGIGDVGGAAAEVVSAHDAYWLTRVDEELTHAFNQANSYADETALGKRVYSEYRSWMEPKLEEYFGTPSEPRVLGQEGMNTATLKRGAQFYFRHCQHCHGISGYGNGATAPFLNPRPRNYTLGKFKIRSNSTDKPSIADLVRTLNYGMPGSMMPPFTLYNDADVEAVAHYVKYLAMRGETEYRVYLSMFGMLVGDKLDSVDGEYDDEEPMTEQLSEWFSDGFETVVSGWEAAVSEDKQIVSEGEPVAPGDDEYGANVAKGHAVFKAQCATCHGNDGRGGGEQSDSMYDDWGDSIKPRNLTRGFYRGGGRPVDLYWRVAGGISGTPMPQFPKLSDEDRWALVNYVKSLAVKNGSK